MDTDPIDPDLSLSLNTDLIEWVRPLCIENRVFILFIADTPAFVLLVFRSPRTATASISPLSFSPLSSLSGAARNLSPLSGVRGRIA
jgi:hypothetical protein